MIVFVEHDQHPDQNGNSRCRRGYVFDYADPFILQMQEIRAGKSTGLPINQETENVLF